MQSCAKDCIASKSRRELSNPYLLSNFGFDTAENEPCKVCPIDSCGRTAIAEPCKQVHCVDLGESFPTSISLQNLASIQPRTSPAKFARSTCPGPHVRLCRRTGRGDPEREPGFLPLLELAAVLLEGLPLRLDLRELRTFSFERNRKFISSFAKKC